MSSVEKLFQCRQCGFCCHGESTVSLNETDQKNMVAALNLTSAQVAERYWRVNGTRVQMKTIEGHCIFYREGCTVYPGRPWRCAQWPLVPAILHDENNFITIRESCPGISRELSYEEFKKILARLLDSDPAGEE
ncbi:MAG: YkgJ family cysteine cluster protein [Desulfocapsaceae bacterium]